MRRLEAAAIALSAAALSASVAIAGEAGHGWDYGAEHGPAHWGELSADYAACGRGAHQSPIDVHPAEAVARGAVAPLRIDWTPFAPEVVDNGHSIEVSAHGAGGGVALGGVRYELLQVHFHHLSEHMIDGRHAPMEAHFVHRGPDGHLLVLGAMIEEGAENPTLRAALALAGAEGHVWAGAVPVDPSALIPENHAGYRYEGSLTTPPCSEIVTWHVFAEPVTASHAQIAAFAARYPDNYRPVAALGHRFLHRAD
jgi:carbonic anhydrase